jgi:hypothetical protein
MVPLTGLHAETAIVTFEFCREGSIAFTETQAPVSLLVQSSRSAPLG